MKLHRLAAYAGIGMGCVGIASVVLIRRVSPQIGPTDFAAISLDPAKMTSAYTALPAVFNSLLILSVLRGIGALLLALALQDLMKAKAPILMRLLVIAASACSALMSIVAIAGMVGHSSFAGSKDMSAYKAFLVMLHGINATAVNVFGWELLLIGWAALSTKVWSRILSCFILAAGIAHFVQFAFDQPLALRGVFVAISMLWLAVILLRNPEPISE